MLGYSIYINTYLSFRIFQCFCTMVYEWNDKVVLITGAATSIGAAVVRILMNEGVKVRNSKVRSARSFACSLFFLG